MYIVNVVDNGAVKIFSRLHRFDEWGMQFVLDVLMRHLPEKEEEEEEDVYKTLV